jgi:hypothetical protein
VTTSGAQEYIGSVQFDSTYITNGGNFSVTGSTTVGSNSTVTTGGGNVTFGGTINSQSGENNSLTVNSSGTTTFNGAIGGTQALSSLTTDSAGTNQINGGSVQTIGAITLDGTTTGTSVQLTSLNNAAIGLVSGEVGFPSRITTGGAVTLTGSPIGTAATPLVFTITPQSITLTQRGTLFFTAPAIPSVVSFPAGSSVTANSVLIAVSGAQAAALLASSAAQTAAAAAASGEASETFGTDSVVQQIEYGTAGDVGTTPPFEHLIERTGLGTPACYEESREGEECK